VKSLGFGVIQIFPKCFSELLHFTFLSIFNQQQCLPTIPRESAHQGFCVPTSHGWREDKTTNFSKWEGRNSFMISMATKEDSRCPHLNGFHSTWALLPTGVKSISFWFHQLSAGASPPAREELRGQGPLSYTRASLHLLRKTWICNNWGLKEFCRFLKLSETLFSTIKIGLKEGLGEWEFSNPKSGAHNSLLSRKKKLKCKFVYLYLL